MILISSSFKFILKFNETMLLGGVPFNNTLMVSSVLYHLKCKRDEMLFNSERCIDNKKTWR